MQTRPLGPDAPEVSAIGFGGMPLSTRPDRPDRAEASNVIHAALDAGVTLIDTADVYCLDDSEIGHNERIVGEALRTWSGDRDSIIVATKGGMTRPDGRWERDGRPAHLKEACERSLEVLDVDRIDLYQLHAPDPTVDFADSVGAMEELRQEGKIRWIGLSNVSVDQVDVARQLAPIQTVQNRLNPFFREALERGVVDRCREEGIGFIAYSPVGGGRLNRKLPDHPVVAPIAERHGVSAHAVVLAWVLARGPNVIAIPGASSVEHAVDSAGAADLTLGEDELEAIDAAEFSTA